MQFHTTSPKCGNFITNADFALGDQLNCLQHGQRLKARRTSPAPSCAAAPSAQRKPSAAVLALGAVVPVLLCVLMVLFAGCDTSSSSEARLNRLEQRLDVLEKALGSALSDRAAETLNLKSQMRKELQGVNEQVAVLRANQQEHSANETLILLAIKANEVEVEEMKGRWAVTLQAMKNLGEILKQPPPRLSQP